jgi:hypothetical protein
MSTRRFVFLEADELALETLWKAAFPGLVYYERETSGTPVEPPTKSTRSSLLEFGEGVVSFDFSGDKGRWRYARSDELESWTAIEHPWPYGHWKRFSKILPSASGSRYAPSLPNVRISDISFGSRRWVAEDRRIASKALRMIGKVGTKNYCMVKWPSMEVHHPAPIGGSMVIGHHAMAWLRSDLRHVAQLRIDDGAGYALRPGPEGQD